MIRTLLTCIPLIFCFVHKASSSENSKQETNGAKSPAVYTAEGGVTKINYIENYASDQLIQIISQSQRAVNECMQLMITDRDKKISVLNSTLAGMIVHNDNYSDKNSKEWAAKIIKEAPEYQEYIENQKKENARLEKVFPRKLTVEVYKAFINIIEKVDIKLIALSEQIPGSKYDQIQYFELFSDNHKTVTPYILRCLKFENGNSVDIKILAGNINTDTVMSCPSMIFKYVSKNNNMAILFKVYPSSGRTGARIGSSKIKFISKPLDLPKSLKYPTNGREIATGDFLDKFNVEFSKFIKLSLANQFNRKQ